MRRAALRDATVRGPAATVHPRARQRLGLVAVSSARCGGPWMNEGVWTRFRECFERNAVRAMPVLTGPSGVPDAVRAHVAASLARFQLGEAGEGRIAKEIDRYRSPAVDDDYRAALKLFVKEEGRHAAILGHLVRSLDGRLLDKTWTERLFVRGRRLLGIELKLLVLLAAEVVGVGCYRAIAERLDDGTVKRA